MKHQPITQKYNPHNKEANNTPYLPDIKKNLAEDIVGIRK